MPNNPAPHLFILTGASRGMGHAMAGQLLAPGHTVLTLARRPDEAPSNSEPGIAADPRHPQLWAVQGETAARRGDGARAMASVKPNRGW